MIKDIYGNTLPEDAVYDISEGWFEYTEEIIEHPAVEKIEQISHPELVEEYPNGGKLYREVIDVPGVPGKEAWTQHAFVKIWHMYTEEEKRDIKKQEEQQRKDAETLKEMIKENALLKAQIQALSEMEDMLEECLIEMAGVVYA